MATVEVQTPILAHSKPTVEPQEHTRVEPIVVEPKAEEVSEKEIITSVLEFAIEEEQTQSETKPNEPVGEEKLVNVKEATEERIEESKKVDEKSSQPEKVKEEVAEEAQEPTTEKIAEEEEIPKEPEVAIEKPLVEVLASKEEDASSVEGAIDEENKE